MQRNLYLVLSFLITYISVSAQTGSFYDINQDLGISEKFNSIFFINEDTAWIAGSNGLLLKTSDGGITWENKDVLPNQNFKKIYFNNPDFGWTYSPDTLLYTTDGGSSWLGINIFGPVNTIFMKDQDNIWRCHDFVVWRTTNGGQSWIMVEYLNLRDLYLFNDMIGWGVGTCIAKSTNGGQTFASTCPYDLYDGCFSRLDRIWAVGTNGTILEISNFPYSPENQSVNTTSTLMSIDFDDELAAGYTVGQDGSIYYTNDEGINWISAPYKYPIDFYSTRVLSPGNVWITGDEVILTNHTGIFSVSVKDTSILIGTYLETYCSARGIPRPKFSLLEYPSGMTIDSITGRIQWTPVEEGDFRIVINAANNFGAAADTFHIYVDDPSSINDPVPIKQFDISCYPNPFNPSTTITFEISEYSMVTAEIFDMLGNKVTTLVSKKEFAPGKHNFVWDAQNYSSGVYFCTFLSGQRSQIIKLLLAK